MNNLKNKLRNKEFIFVLCLFIISFFIRLIAIKLLNFPQTSDFKTLLEAAQDFKVGNYSFQNQIYFKLWAYQTGFVIYEGIILKIFNSVLVLKVLNALYSSTLVILIYIIGKRICSSRSAMIASILYMIFPFPLYLNSVLANHHLSTFLIYLGILFLLKNDKQLKDYIVSAVLISFGNIIRPEAIIIITTLLLYELFRLKKDKIKDTILRLFAFIFVYLLIGMVCSFAIQKLDINKEGLSNNDPLWKFVLGFNYDSCGYYDKKDEPNLLLTRSKKIELIKDRALSNPYKTSKLLFCKVNRFWIQSNISVKNEVYKNKVYNIVGIKIKFSSIQNIVIIFNQVLYLVSFIMCIFGCIVNIKKILKDESLFFTLLIMVTFGVYLLIEIQPRYAYFIHIAIFILSTYGYEYIFQKIKNRKRVS